jgi:hypothetical protein
VFDIPKSPFEEKMQQQANQLRKTSVCSSDTDNEGWSIQTTFTLTANIFSHGQKPGIY